LSTSLSQVAITEGEINGAATQNAMVAVSVAAGTERSLLADALLEGRISAGVNQDITELIAAQDQAFTGAALVATPAQQVQLDQIRAPNPQLDQFRADTQRLLAGQRGGDPAVYAQVSQRRLDSILGLTRLVSTELAASAAATQRNNLIRVGLVAALSLLVLIVVGVTVSRLARSIVGPLRALRVGASDAAHVNLPHAVSEIETNGPDAVEALPPVLPPGIAAGPETLDVARAVDNLGAEAVRLAASQVRLRRTLDDAFVSMSRRSQSMVEKQLAIIDELESTEEDPDQLRNLFRLDHLAARMRRYNDNLLVLAGSAMRNRTTSPVRVAELFRAATSEMEQYERVRLQPVGGAAVAGAVAGELIHLLAELLDNAAMYSPPSSSIVLSAAFTSDGGLHIEVVDSGVGIPTDELDRLNARLSRSESLELQAPSRIGLFVVARLARRGGFQVNLRQRPDANGTVAQVVVPPDAVIGAPGSTGEQPLLTGLAGLSGLAAAAADSRMPSLNEPGVAPPVGVPAPASASEPDGLTRRRDLAPRPVAEPVSGTIDIAAVESNPLPRRPRPTARPEVPEIPEVPAGPKAEVPDSGPSTGDLLAATQFAAAELAVSAAADAREGLLDTRDTGPRRATPEGPSESTEWSERTRPLRPAELKQVSNLSAPASPLGDMAPAAW
ncbi:MAG TPA: ATP-binding protein, partial [Streptosporangiaceae bacterium]|nr:ATP-binding protein [Streptosporangiaceae bacterium]